MIESINAITLATHNMARAVRLYRILGFEIVHGGRDESSFKAASEMTLGDRVDRGGHWPKGQWSLRMKPAYFHFGAVFKDAPRINPTRVSSRKRRQIAVDPAIDL